MNALVVAKRELGTFLVSPAAYLIGAFFLFITGLMFSFSITSGDNATLSSVVEVGGTSLIFLIPVLTTHLLVRESQRGTLELLMTAPVFVWEIVIGKFIAAFSFFLLMLVPTAVYWLLLTLVEQPDLPVILSGYVGILLLGALFISIGVFSSSVCSSQIVAVILSFGLSLLIWLLGWLDFNFAGTIGEIFLYVSPQQHFLDFTAGIMKLSNVTYFLSAIACILLVTAYAFKMRLWR